MSYIHEGAHASYVHWWSQQLYWVEQAYRWDKFRSAADDIGYLYPHLRPQRRRRRYNHGSSVRRWIKPWDISTSGESSFRQDGYEAKVQSDHARSCQDWRKHKGFKRDKAKRDRRGCPVWIKRQCNKDYRQFERECIDRGHYDKLGSKLRKDFFDPWMWD